MKIFAFQFICFIFYSSAVLSIEMTHCDDKELEIREKSEDSNIIKLEFGSVWRVKREYVVDARTLLRLDKVKICDNGLKNVSTGQIVGADRLR